MNETYYTELDNHSDFVPVYCPEIYVRFKDIMEAANLLFMTKSGDLPSKTRYNKYLGILNDALDSEDNELETPVYGKVHVYTSYEEIPDHYKHFKVIASDEIQAIWGSCEETVQALTEGKFGFKLHGLRRYLKYPYDLRWKDADYESSSDPLSPSFYIKEMNYIPFIDTNIFPCATFKYMGTHFKYPCAYYYKNLTDFYFLLHAFKISRLSLAHSIEHKYPLYNAYLGMYFRQDIMTMKEIKDMRLNGIPERYSDRLRLDDLHRFTDKLYSVNRDADIEYSSIVRSDSFNERTSYRKKRLRSMVTEVENRLAYFKERMDSFQSDDFSGIRY